MLVHSRPKSVPVLLSALLIALASLGRFALASKPELASEVRAAQMADIVAFHDDFERPDSLTLDSPWVEGNESTIEITTADAEIGPGFVEVEGGTMAFHYENHSQKTQWELQPCVRPYAFAPLPQAIFALPARLSFTFAPHLDERIQHFVGLMAADGGLVMIDARSDSYVRTAASGFASPERVPGSTTLASV